MKPKHKADVIVVGGGPAGSFLASALSARGKEVIILEKEEFPRDKPCGGGLTQKAVSLLDDELDEIIENRCYELCSSYAGRRPFSYTLDRPIIYMVQRASFDHFLLECARKQGAMVHEGERVKSINISSEGVEVKTKSARYQGSYVAGTDGAAGIVSRSLAMVHKKSAGLAVTKKIVPQKRDDAAEWQGKFAMDFGIVPRGYGWVFPKADHLNVGVFTQLPSLSGLRETLAEYIRMRLPQTANDVEADTSHADLALIPFGGKKNKLHGPRAILAGDSASLVDPLLGEGIYYALRSASIAAEVLIKALDTGSAEVLSEYSARVHDELVSELRASLFISRIFYGMPGLSYRTLFNQRVMEGYRKTVSSYSKKGETPYRRLLKEALSSFLFLR